MTTTAWKLLQQDWQLTPKSAEALTVLLTETPVALRGEEALVPLFKLLPERPQASSASSRTRAVSVLKSEEAALFELLRRSWPIKFADGRAMSLPFVTDYTLVDGSKFLRYRLHTGLIEVLGAIKEHYRLDALA